MVQPFALGESREAALEKIVGPPQIGGANYAQVIDQTKTHYIMSKLADSTRNGYEKAWGKWALYRQQQGRDPMLCMGTRLERKESEEELCDYVVHLARFMQKGEGTIKQHLFAIRYHHLISGFEDPLLHRQRLWGLLGGLAKLAKPHEKEVPSDASHAKLDEEVPIHRLGLAESGCRCNLVSRHNRLFLSSSCLRIPGIGASLVVRRSPAW